MLLIQHISDTMLTRPVEQEMASTLIALKQTCTVGREKSYVDSKTYRTSDVFSSLVV